MDYPFRAPFGSALDELAAVGWPGGACLGLCWTQAVQVLVRPRLESIAQLG